MIIKFFRKIEQTQILISSFTILMKIFNPPTLMKPNHKILFTTDVIQRSRHHSSDLFIDEKR